jgi:hypothetical protein
MRSIPNPVRFPLLLFVVILFMSVGYGAAGTGGVDPSLIEQEEGVSTGITVGWIIRDAGIPLLAVFSIGLGFAVILARPGGVLAGLRFALGSNRPEVSGRATRALAIGGRAVTWSGLCVGVGACGVVGAMLVLGRYLNVIRMDWDSYTDVILTAIGVATVVPPIALAFGRVALGVLADGARVRSGEPGGMAFGSRQDFALAVVILVPVFYLFLVTAK